MSRTVSIDDVRKYPDLPWDREGLSMNSTLMLYDVLYLELPNAVGDWDWRSISRCISSEQVREYPDLPWNRRYLSCNRSLTMHDILDLPLKEGEWDWY